ncbi:MAG: hypothetical protein GWN87_02380, partial [Desulfuromonadales bacterium]|nr:hypothetical protein [Desulfuromonadales bacterium]
LLEPGDTVSDQSANARLFYLDTISLSFIGGARDLVLTPAGTEEIAFGPQRLDLTNGNLYQLFITDSAGGGLPIEVVLEDDFRP